MWWARYCQGLAVWWAWLLCQFAAKTAVVKWSKYTDVHVFLDAPVHVHATWLCEAFGLADRVWCFRFVSWECSTTTALHYVVSTATLRHAMVLPRACPSGFFPQESSANAPFPLTMTTSTSVAPSIRLKEKGNGGLRWIDREREREREGGREG